MTFHEEYRYLYGILMDFMKIRLTKQKNIHPEGHTSPGYAASISIYPPPSFPAGIPARYPFSCQTGSMIQLPNVSEKDRVFE
jgi:hypothetical protein